MNKLGMGEFLIILFIAIVVLGPDKLPKLGRSLGKAVGSMKRYIHEATKDLDEISELKDIQKDVQDIQKDLQAMGRSVEKSVQEEVDAVEKDMAKTQKDVEKAVEQPPEEPPEPEPEPNQEKAVETPLADEAENNNQEESNT
jgi:sec-independent protein translocase protein TatB